MPAHVSAAYNIHYIGSASRVYSVFRELRICLKMSCVSLLYATISQEKPAGFQLEFKC